MNDEQASKKREHVFLLMAAVALTGIGLAPHLYLIDIVGACLLLVCSGGEAGDGLPMWLSAIVAGAANVAVFYYLFRVALKLRKGGQKPWES